MKRFRLFCRCGMCFPQSHTSPQWSSAAIPVFFSWVPLKACGMTGNKMKAETTD